ncbi:MAG: hypothetical protein EOP06_01905 [Proteobacteria bacterium]|nr:MAG: hypothetical protein EOP06_01905 [Pseudomonadota bacterium]
MGQAFKGIIFSFLSPITWEISSKRLDAKLLLASEGHEFKVIGPFGFFKSPADSEDSSAVGGVSEGGDLLMAEVIFID